ncbi:PREDICTED: carbohydrate-binding X8 domain-containing protein-like [Camelina sativa]|uniref:Carbohydrate-binding X8 domain-containing protein-like n=1 Tax=Camelina sativa TaxID=90675 RepID=A0ABM0YCR4_CAMSA|nr:PREDICTED: carbohydrate-binding X8 domain-containing protein-like [Camelina sativa]
MALLLPLFLLSFMFTYSNAAVCVCKDASEPELQKVIDFACGGGADCTQIQTTGACYQPNTIKNHCDVAVNSYYQKKAPTGATCDFNGAAVISTSPPSTTSSCLSSSSSNGTPTTGNTSTGNSTAGTPGITNPTTGNSTGNSTTSTPTNDRPTSSSLAFPGNTMGPASSTSGLGGGDPNGGEELSVRTTTIILLATIAAVALKV